MTTIYLFTTIKGIYVTEIKHYKTNACQTCPARSQCATNPCGRILERSQYAKALEENGNRIKYELKKYLLRQQIVEHPFGTIKRQWSMDHILLKGLKKNNGEFGLIYFTYNFRRVMNIIGFKEFIKQLHKLFLQLFSLCCNLVVYRVKLFLPANSALQAIGV